MRAAILAAGEGSRLRNHFNGPKPLFPLLGIPLIVRNILSLRQAGIQEFVIITGCYDQELRRALGDGSKWGVSLTYVYNENWQQGNGTSVKAYEQVYRPNEKFILIMADHMFEPEVISTFVAQANLLRDDEVLLAADKNLEAVHDLEESTKIFMENNAVRQLGKKLPNYQAVDCGLFLCTKALLDALSTTIENEKYTLTDGINVLAERGKLKLHYIENSWVDVDDPDSIKPAKQMLLRGLVSKKDGFISRHINRKVSLKITELLASTTITPNHISFISFIICLVSAFCFAFGLPLIGGLLAQIGSILDGTDGEIARLKFQQSKYGELFDSVLDRYADFFIIAGMTYAWLLQTEPITIPLLISIAALTGQPMSMIIKEKYKTLTKQTFISKQNDGIFHYLPVNRDGRLFLIFLGGVFNLIPHTLLILAILTHGQTITRLLLLKRQLKEH